MQTSKTIKKTQNINGTKTLTHNVTQHINLHSKLNEVQSDRSNTKAS